MTTHTPGPWAVEPFLTPDKDEDPMMVYRVLVGDLQDRLDNAPMNEDGDYDLEYIDALHAENQANASLIAAAPALLEALKEVMQDLQDIGKVDSETVTHIQKAIAQAEGEVKCE